MSEDKVYNSYSCCYFELDPFLGSSSKNFHYINLPYNNKPVSNRFRIVYAPESYPINSGNINFRIASSDYKGNTIEYLAHYETNTDFNNFNSLSWFDKKLVVIEDINCEYLLVVNNFPVKVKVWVWIDSIFRRVTDQ